MRMRRPKLRLRQRPAVELAVRRERQPLQHHQRGRHHVVRQLPRQRGPQRCGLQHRARRRHHIADQPLPARTIRPRDHGGLRHARLPSQRRLDLARLDPEPAQLHLRVGAAQELQHAVRTATAPGPRSGTSGCRPSAVRVGDKPLRRQRGPVQIAARQANARDVQLADHTRRHRLKPAVQHIGLRVPDRTADRHLGRLGRRRRPSASRRSRPRSARTGCPAEPAADIVQTRSRSSAGSASPLQITRRRLAQALFSLAAFTPHAREKPAASTARSAASSRAARRIVSTSRAGSRCAPGAAITSRAPTISGQKNSHTETSKLNGVFCSTTSSPVSP